MREHAPARGCTMEKQMELDKKVVAAVGVGVTAYIAAEKAAERAARMRSVRPAASAWTHSGRQEIMRNRQMWQLRIVPR